MFHIGNVLPETGIGGIQAGNYRKRAGKPAAGLRGSAKRQRRSQKKGKGRALAWFSSEQCSPGCYSFSWAYSGARTAIQAFAGINPAFAVFFGDSFRRTFTVTGTAINAGVADFVCHILPLSIRIYQTYHKTSQMASE
jgi:hypothetical protein